MAEIELKIAGGAELERKLEELPRKAAERIVRRECQAAAVPWRDEMASRVRRGWHVWQRTTLRDRRNKRTAEGGRTRDFGVIATNIRMQTSVEPGDLASSTRVYPDPRAFWAKFLEFGTAHQRAFPFIRPSFESEKSTVLDRFISGVRDALAAVGLRTS